VGGVQVEERLLHQLWAQNRQVPATT
jgi:hypothetical protein